MRYQSASRDGSISLQYGGMPQGQVEAHPDVGGKVRNVLRQDRFKAWAKDYVDVRGLSAFGAGKTVLTELEDTLFPNAENKGFAVMDLYRREARENPYKSGTLQYNKWEHEKRWGAPAAAGGDDDDSDEDDTDEEETAGLFDILSGRANPRLPPNVPVASQPTRGEFEQARAGLAATIGHTPPSDNESLRTLPAPVTPSATPTPIDVGGIKKDLASASPEQRIRILEILQSSTGIQELVKAGLLKWEDLMKKNPDEGQPGHISNPGGQPPEMIIDADGLNKLQTALEEFTRRKQINQTTERATYAREVTQAGPRKSTGGFLPGKKPWMAPSHVQGRLPNMANVAWTGEASTKIN